MEENISHHGISKNKETSSSSISSNTIYKEITGNDFNQDPLNLTLFQAYYRKTYNLVFEIVENFIGKINSEYNFEFENNQYYKSIVDAIHNYFSLKIFEKIKTDKTLDIKLENYESMTSFDDKTELFYKNILKNNIEEYLHLIQTFALIFVKKNQKDLMQKLGIYKQNKSSKNKKVKDLEIIYSSIPFTQEKLIKDNLGVIDGKSDIKTAVFETIKRLENSNNIEKSKYDPGMIFENYQKSLANKSYQELIEKNLKKIENKK